MITLFEEASDLRELAERIQAVRQDVKHVELGDVLFARELLSKPRALGRCFALTNHPIRLFTKCRFAIVVYESNCECLTSKQLALLVWHEMKHIPLRGDRMVDHDVKDFLATLGLAGLEWTEPGTDVPDILHNNL